MPACFSYCPMLKLPLPVFAQQLSLIYGLDSEWETAIVKEVY